MENKSTYQKIEDELNKLLDTLNETTIYEDRKELLDEISCLYEMKMEYDKLDWEYADKEVNHVLEDRERRREYFKIGIDVVAILAPLAFYGVWMSKGLEYEKTGRFSSDTFRWFSGKMKPGR